jgi:hypothetical protein
MTRATKTSALLPSVIIGVTPETKGVPLEQIQKRLGIEDEDAITT